MPYKNTNSKTEPTKLSSKDKKGLSKGLNKIVSDSKKKAKQESDKTKAPKTNWITKL